MFAVETEERICRVQQSHFFYTRPIVINTKEGQHEICGSFGVLCYEVTYPSLRLHGFIQIDMLGRIR
jgi:hypothetical protein